MIYGMMTRTFHPLLGLLLSISLLALCQTSAGVCDGVAGVIGSEETTGGDGRSGGGGGGGLCPNGGDDDRDVLGHEGDGDDPTLRRAGEFGRFLQKMFDINESYDGDDRTEQEALVLRGLLDHVGMDPALLGLSNSNDHHDGDGKTNDQWHGRKSTTLTVRNNWYEEIHRRIEALAPAEDCFFITYHGKPTPRQVELIAAMDHDAVRYATDDRDGTVDDRTLRLRAFRPFRHRGGVANVARMFQMALHNPLRYWIGFAVPNDEVLDRIAALGRPVVEVGAGTGYWTALLRSTRDVDVVAYDVEPPTPDDNVYFHHTFTDVKRGTCDTIFSSQEMQEGGEEEEEDRVLLIIWPNSPDNVDNHPSFGSPELGETWDTECLQSYLRAGGRTVVYVGEREENVPLNKGAPRDVGLSATGRFQEMLREEFTLKETIEIPNWWYSDDATIWERRRTTSN